MAFPAVVSTATWTASADSLGLGSITLPSGIAAGDLLVALVSVDNQPTCTPSAGWTTLGVAASPAQVVGAVFWKLAAGDASDALTVALSSSNNGSAIVYCLRGADSIEGTGYSPGSSTSTINPPSHTASVTTVIQWILFHAGNYTQVASSPPTGYGDLRTALNSVSGSASASAMTRQASVATESPAAFAASTANYYAVWTLAVFMGATRAELDLPGPLGAPALHGAVGDPVMTLEIPTPLAHPAALAFAPPVALLALPSPLGTLAAHLHIVTFARMALASPLRTTPRLRAHLPPVALLALPGPLGAPRLRARHRQTRLAWLVTVGPLGAPRLLGQQRVVAALSDLPEIIADARQRLLSDPFPLRRAIALPDYRDDVILPWVYGRVTLAPVALDAAGLDWLVADHPIVAVTAVRDDGATLDGWQLVQQLDATGCAVARLRLTRPPKGQLAVDAVGRRHPVTGAVLEHPADIAEDLLSACGWRVPADAFHALRDAYPGVVLAGVLQEAQTVREAVSRVIGSVDADWSASPLRAWLPEPGDALATLTPATCDSASAACDHASLCTVLRVSYGYDWAAGAPRGALTVTAADRLEDLGEIAQDLDLPWVRAARDALALATAALSRRARARWTFDLAVAPADRYRPGDTLTLDDPWIPRGAVIVTEVERGRTGQRLSALRYAGDAPRIELTGRGQLLDAAGVEPVRVDFRDGVATFTILNELGAPLAGASVTLDERDTRTTDLAGQVQFATTRGLHTLLIVANGYTNLDVEVTI